jgi:hypothetical protein
MPDCGKNKNTALKTFQRGAKFDSRKSLALTGLEAWVGLVDDIDTALATDQLVIAVTLHQTLEGIADFHIHTYIWRKSAELNCAQSIAAHP